MGAILSAAMMLDHIDWPAEARAIEHAVQAAIKEGITTPDLGGKMGTKQVGDWLGTSVSK
jgi:isocitrate/isopropylmalate dehydrogenase